MAVLRRALLAASASTRVRRIVTTAPLTRDVVARFVAGDGADDALRVTGQLLGDGLDVSLDYLGEDTTDREQAAAVAAEYVALLGRLGYAGLAAGGRAEVSVKPTAVGLGLAEHGEKTAIENIARICTAARNAGTTVTIDMEDHTRVEPTLRILAELRADFPDLGCVIQSYLRRSAGDCEDLAVAGSRVRLCKGAYSSPDGIAFLARSEVDRSYARCMRILLNGAGYPMLATHDPRLIDIATARAQAAGRDPDSFEYQLLYGIRPAEQLRLAGTGARVRVYVPYGSDWYGYLVRRLAERPANLAFFLRSLATRS
jgi:proline dehydrogenase